MTGGLNPPSETKIRGVPVCVHACFSRDSFKILLVKNDEMESQTDSITGENLVRVAYIPGVVGSLRGFLLSE